MNYKKEMNSATITKRKFEHVTKVHAHNTHTCARFLACSHHPSPFRHATLHQSCHRWQTEDTRLHL